MDREVLSRFLDAAKEIAQTAGRAILEIPVDDAGVEAKGDGSPLTRADMASHHAIEAGLAVLEPKLPILSEEGDLDADVETWDVFWCVDPLDGTKEFIKGLDEYTTNIAIIENGAAILGAVYVPVKDVLYYAAEGLGAWKVEGGGAAQAITASDCDTPRTAVVSRSHLSEETEQFLERLGVTDTVQHGSSIKIVAAAEGSADVYPRHGPTCLWDTAAGAAVAREAGCVVVDLKGTPLSYNPAEGIKRPGFLVYPRKLAPLIEKVL